MRDDHGHPTHSESAHSAGPQGHAWAGLCTSRETPRSEKVTVPQNQAASPSCELRLWVSHTFEGYSSPDQPRVDRSHTLLRGGEPPRGSKACIIKCITSREICRLASLEDVAYSTCPSWSCMLTSPRVPVVRSTSRRPTPPLPLRW